MRYVEYREPKTSKGTEKFLSVLFLVGFLAMLGIAGWVEGLG